jgi:hypothetical protein
MIFLTYLPLATALVGMFSITYVKCHDFDCMDVMHDIWDCDVCRCYENGGFGCLCCTVCENSDQSEQLHDDSSDAFRSHYYSYSKKS